MATKKKTKTLDERIVEAFKKMAKSCEYEVDDFCVPYGFGSDQEKREHKALAKILEELATEEQDTTAYAVSLTSDDKDTIENELDGWCLSAAAKASIRKALKI